MFGQPVVGLDKADNRNLHLGQCREFLDSSSASVDMENSEEIDTSTSDVHTNIIHAKGFFSALMIPWSSGEANCMQILRRHI